MFSSNTCQLTGQVHSPILSELTPHRAHSHKHAVPTGSSEKSGTGLASYKSEAASTCMVCVGCCIMTGERQCECMCVPEGARGLDTELMVCVF